MLIRNVTPPRTDAECRSGKRRKRHWLTAGVKSLKLRAGVWRFLKSEVFFVTARRLFLSVMTRKTSHLLNRRLWRILYRSTVFNNPLIPTLTRCKRSWSTMGLDKKPHCHLPLLYFQFSAEIWRFVKHELDLFSFGHYVFKMRMDPEHWEKRYLSAENFNVRSFAPLNIFQLPAVRWKCLPRSCYCPADTRGESRKPYPAPSCAFLICEDPISIRSAIEGAIDAATLRLASTRAPPKYDLSVKCNSLSGSEAL